MQPVRTAAQKEALETLHTAREELRRMHADKDMPDTERRAIMTAFEKAVNGCWDVGCTSNDVLVTYAHVEFKS